MSTLFTKNMVRFRPSTVHSGPSRFVHFSNPVKLRRLTLKDVGSIVRIAPNDVDITDISAVRTIYSVKETFLKTDFYKGLVGPGQESMFSTLNIEFHRRHRRLLAQPMSETSLKSYLPTIRALSDRAIGRIADEMEKRGAADIHKWFMFMTADVIGRLTFGDSFRMLELGRVRL